MNLRRKKYLLIILATILLVLLSGCKNQSTRCPVTILENMATATFSDYDDQQRNVMSFTGEILEILEFDCKWTSYCENGHWIIYEKGNGCEVAYQVTVSGTTKVVPVFYIDPSSKEIHGAEENLGTSFVEAGLEWFRESGFRLP